MKKIITLLLFIFSINILNAQCDVSKCIGDSLILSGITNAVNPQFTWSVNPVVVFSGQSTAQIIFENLQVGDFTVSLSVVDDNGCTNDTSLNICVLQGIATLNLPTICQGDPCIPVSGGSSNGIYQINGVDINQLCESNDGQVVTFISTEGNCPGTTTSTFNVNPRPTITITH